MKYEADQYTPRKKTFYDLPLKAERPSFSLHFKLSKGRGINKNIFKKEGRFYYK